VNVDQILAAVPQVPLTKSTTRITTHVVTTSSSCSPSRANAASEIAHQRPGVGVDLVDQPAHPSLWGIMVGRPCGHKGSDIGLKQAGGVRVRVWLDSTGINGAFGYRFAVPPGVFAFEAGQDLDVGCGVRRGVELVVQPFLG